SWASSRPSCSAPRGPGSTTRETSDDDSDRDLSLPARAPPPARPVDRLPRARARRRRGDPGPRRGDGDELVQAERRHRQQREPVARDVDARELHLGARRHRRRLVLDVRAELADPRGGLGGRRRAVRERLGLRLRPDQLPRARGVLRDHDRHDAPAVPRGDHPAVHPVQLDGHGEHVPAPAGPEVPGHRGVLRVPHGAVPARAAPRARRGRAHRRLRALGHLPPRAAAAHAPGRDHQLDLRFHLVVERLPRAAALPQAPRHLPAPDRAAAVRGPDVGVRLRRPDGHGRARAGPGAAVLRRVPAVPGGRRRDAGAQGMTAVGAERDAARQPDAGPVAGASGGAAGRPDERLNERPGERAEDRPGEHVPGEGRFALLGETLLTGLLVLAGGLFVVTLPAALAAGVAHLRRYVAGYDTSAHSFARDWRAAVRETWLLGGLALAAGAVVLVNTGLTASGVLPGASVVRWVTWAAAACAAVVLVRAAAAWSDGAREDGEGPPAGSAETDRGPFAERSTATGARALLARGAARAG